MLDRTSIVDEQFINRVRNADFPKPNSTMSLDTAELDKKTAIELFDSQIKSRLLDLIARQLKEKGLSFYTIGSSGHEGNAVWGQVFRQDDMAFLHYRSGAFYLQRAKKMQGSDGVRDILLSLVAAASDPISGGRHKVFGSVSLNIPPQTSTIASHLPKALGAALSITRAKELNIEGSLASDSIILCSFGDASLNHASAQATLNACSWIAQQNYPLPLVFICEDNGIGISVPTPTHWVERSISQRPGLHYIACDGLSIADTYAAAQEAEYLARVKKQPVFLHMGCVRLMGHAGSDIESQYCTQEEIELREAHDPLLYTAGLLYREGWMSIQDIVSLYQDNKDLIEAKAATALREPKLSSAEEVMSSLVPMVLKKQAFPLPSEAKRTEVFASAFPQLTQKRNLCQQINFALTDLMIQYPNMLVFGEDVGKKGGVYRVTADLQARFGQRRVFDTILDETTILGTAIGMAHNGFIPVPEIQFLAYLHNAEDQLRGEASTLSFFSSGQYQNPMVLRIASLAYQKGFGGHFHNDNSIAVLRDLPGVIVACPSNGPDAAKMLRTCVRLAHEEGRVVVFLEPIALYMTKDLHVLGDNGWLSNYPAPDVMIKPGEVGVHGEGDTVILTYANGYYLSRQAAKVLEKASSGLKIRRITGKDCFIPLGNAWQYLLPSKESIIEAVIALTSDKMEKESGRLIVS
ncbi:MAG: MFS transporter [Legionella longbeachae]|nr:MFS transporter [Legionella longbeachae]